MFELKEVKKEEIPFDLLYLADSDEDQINKYINESVFFAAVIEGNVVGSIGIKELNSNEIEIVSVAVYEKWQNKTIGRHLVEKAIAHGRDKKYKEIIIKTGNCGIKQIALYMKCGFRMSRIVRDYFLENYKTPIYEEGIQCVDQIWLTCKIYSEEEIQERIHKFWSRFLETNPQYKKREYDVWSFGYGNYQADKLLGYVRQGLKTGTSSAREMYGEDEELPQAGDLSLVTFGNGLPGCIIKTVEVRNKAFDEINEEEARWEGEGDLSLNYWRQAHEDFFRREYDASSKTFSYKIPVIYEKFEILFI